MSFHEKRQRALFVDALLPEHHCGSRWGRDVQACLVFPERCRAGGKLAAEAAVNTLMAWAAGVGPQSLIRVAGLPASVGGGRISIAS